MESSSDIMVMSVIRTVLNQSVAKGFPSSTFQTAMNRAVQKCMVVSYVVNDVPKSTIDAASSTVPVAKFVKNVAEMGPL